MSCPKLQIEGVQNLNIENCVQEHSLFSADNDYEMFQREKKVITKEMRFPQEKKGGFMASSCLTMCTSTRAQFLSAPPIPIS
jgi:hypothetical protein